MAFASYTPTQMGSTVSLPTSFSNTIGMLVTGSIINPRIFISTSIRAPRSDSLNHFSHQTVREARRASHVHVASGLQFRPLGRGEVHHLDLRRSAYPLLPRLVLPFYHDANGLAQVPPISMRLDLLLFAVQHRQPPCFLGVGN